MTDEDLGEAGVASAKPLSRRRAALATLFGSGANTFIVAVQAVTLVPLYLKYCGPRLYGAWLASGDFLVWIQAFDLGLPNLLIQKAGSALGGGNRSLAARWFGAGIWCLGIVSLIVVLLGAVAAHQVPHLFHIQGAEAGTLSACFALGAVAAGMSLFNNIFIGYSRAIQDTVFLNRALVISSFFGFAASLGALLMGMGLWSIPIGLMTRSGLGLTASLWYVLAKIPSDLQGTPWPDRPILREYFRTMPATAAGGISYALMNQSETAIIGAITRPEFAAIYNLTKKAIEVARSLVDMLAFATYGGFAHLVSSRNGDKIRKVYYELRSARLAAAFGAASAYLVVNGSLVSRWVGSGLYGGPLLTLLIAVQFLASGEAFLVNYLYRASGHVVRGSWLLGIEAILRVSLMALGVLYLGIKGVPIATILVCIPFSIFLGRILLKSLPEPIGPTQGAGLSRLYAFGSVILGVSFWVGLVLPRFGWIGILSWGSLVFLGTLLFFVGFSPELRPWLRVIGLGRFSTQGNGP